MSIPLKAWPLIVVALVLFAKVGVALIQPAQAETGNGQQNRGLHAVRLIGPRSTLDKIAAAATRVRWTESHYDGKGRLVLPIPQDYTSDDFGRLLEAIDPFTADLRGLQMIGPHGGPFDDKGVEQPDE